MYSDSYSYLLEFEIFTFVYTTLVFHPCSPHTTSTTTSHPRTDVDQAVTIFKELEAEDPYRLDNLDTYSNLLYVKEMRVELSYLAHRVVQVDKYRVETCCVIGVCVCVERMYALLFLPCLTSYFSL